MSADRLPTSTPARAGGPSAGPGPALPGLPSAELQQLWFALRRREWSSLVIVPVTRSTSALRLARALAEVGETTRRAPVKVIKAEGLDPAASGRLISDLAAASTAWSTIAASAAARGAAATTSGLTMVVLEPVVTNPLGIQIALATDAAVLCVELGNSELALAEKSIDLVGRERFLGCVTLRGEK